MGHRRILVSGDVGRAGRDALRDAAAALGVPVESVHHPADLERRLAAESPFAVIVAMADDGALDACACVRMRPRLADVPVLGISRDRNDLAFLEVFQWGGDDLVDASASAIVRRLRPVREADLASTVVQAATASAVVAGADATWRNVMARALVNASIDVVPATNQEDAIEAARGARFVIAAHDLPPDGAVAAARAAREAGVQAPWVVSAPPRAVPEVREAIDGLTGVDVTDAFAPPENALFLANELALAPTRDQRADERLLYGTAVAFRIAGRDSDEVGFTYNVSAGGMFVRTLASVELGDEVWVELRAPRHDRRVRLAASVAWRRPFGRSARAVVPPGFGLRITDGLLGDAELWCRGCDALLDAQLVAPVLLAPIGAPDARRASTIPSQLAPAIV